MSTLRRIGIAGVLPLVAALAMALSGCGEGAQETKPDGTIQLAPGTVQLDQETGQSAPTKK